MIVFILCLLAIFIYIAHLHLDIRDKDELNEDASLFIEILKEDADEFLYNELDKWTKRYQKQKE